MPCLYLISLTRFSKRDTNLFFEPNIAGAPSVVTDTNFLKSSCIFDTHPRKPFKISFPVVLPSNGTNLTSSYVTVNSEFIPQTNIPDCTVSLTAILSSTATE